MLRQRTLRRAAAATLAASGCAIAALIGPPPLCAAVGVVTRWDGKLAKLESRLAAGDWDRRRARKLVDDMVEEYAGLEAEPAALARAAVLLAIAEAGAGRRDEAAWHWHAARALEPAATRIDLAPFADAGRFLAELEARLHGELPRRYAAPPGPVTRPAKPVKQPDRVYFDASRVRRGRVPPAVRIEVVVDLEGRPREPVLEMPSRFPGFAFAALEVVSGWRFEPARAGGDAVASLVFVQLPYPRDSVPGI